MENEILLATSDGFYYEGIPSTGSYSSSTTKAKDISVEQDMDGTLKQIGSAIIISQIIIVTLAVMCIIKGILNSINNKKIVGLENDLSEESVTGEFSKRKITAPYFVSSIVLFVIYGIINIIKGFFINLL